MTGVPRRAPYPPEQSVLEIADPMRATHNALWVADVAHLLGHQLSHVHEMAFGSTESDNAVYRFLYEPHPNAEELWLIFVPLGNTATSPPGAEEGTIDVPGSVEISQPVWTRTVNVANLSQIVERKHFRIEVTPGFQEVTYEVTDVRLHSVLAYEKPRRDILPVASIHNVLDASFANPAFFITDNGLTADPYGRTRRGMPTLGEAINLARASMRRCLTPYVNPGVTVNPAALNTWTDVSGFDYLFIRGRDVKGSTTALDRMRFRFFIYVSALTAASTWQFRVATQDGVRTSAASANITAVGWAPGIVGGVSAGLAFDVGAASGEKIKLQVQQTVGGGGDTITVNGFDGLDHVA